MRRRKGKEGGGRREEEGVREEGGRRKEGRKALREVGNEIVMRGEGVRRE